MMLDSPTSSPGQLTNSELVEKLYLHPALPSQKQAAETRIEQREHDQKDPENI